MTKKTDSKETKPKAGQELTIETLPPITYSISKAGVAKLKKECSVFKQVPETPADYQALTKQIARVRTTRTGIEKRRKELKAPLLEYSAEIDGQAKELKEALQALEDPLAALKAEADKIKQAEKEAKERAEADRLAALNERLNEIKNRPFLVNTPEDCQAALDEITAMDISADDTWQELAPLAEVARQEAMMKIRQRMAQLEADRLAEENRQQELKELETQRQAAEAERKAQLERQRELDEREAKIRAAEEQARQAQEKAEREAQEKADAEAREKAEKEAAKKLAAEQKRQAQAQAKWKKEMKADLKPLMAYLNNLDEITAPVDQVKTQEAQNILGDLRVAIGEAQVAVDGLNTLVNEK